MENKMKEQFKQELLDLLSKYNSVLEIDSSMGEYKMVVTFCIDEKTNELDLGYSIGEFK
jgi:hypothetical protein